MRERSRLVTEVWLVLIITFGTSGLRAALRLVDSLLKAPLNQQSTTLIDASSNIHWLDLALQATSALTLIGWGGLAWYLLGWRWQWPRWRDLAHGAGFAAMIGLPGLALYVAGVHLGLSKVVVPATEAVQIPTSLLWAFANGFGEEVVVVMYLVTRLGQLGWKPWQAIAASSALRGSYHLYQGVSAGFGNIVMGVVFAWYFHRTGRVWPLVLAHFLIDAVAYIAYPLLDLSFLGI
ncbi:CPBP family intramembrane metalloprotease [Corynebacterium sp. CNCTC7651]|uniref:CPBP family intramembrane glutamic endopeptidase n=1 Tax=Corynebacterium sp. CNCTC7651 TaxID=2815361 RepID=UPI001F47B620|nr:CPBP family intramembrane glutamic endopeptidase [Corynebacterium sp. CNCTC7651]UIZ92047.1 CPBP family intramembrane metalloprotease [Corynebacterium sp. CNCTC7651]